MKKQYFYLLLVIWALITAYVGELVISEHQTGVEVKKEKLRHDIKLLKHQIDSLRHDSAQRAFDRQHYIAGTAEIPEPQPSFNQEISATMDSITIYLHDYGELEKNYNRKH